MPNRDIHMLFSGLTALGVYYIDKRERNEEMTFGEIIGVSFGGAVSGLLPDILEPATNPNHRSLAHSVTAGAGMWQLKEPLQNNYNLTPNERAFWKAMGSAYLVHLLLDMTTPRGLPLLSNGG